MNLSMKIKVNFLVHVFGMDLPTISKEEVIMRDLLARCLLGLQGSFDKLFRTESKHSI